MSDSKITVIGSINMDLVTSTNVIPNQGETVLGTNFLTMPGGKGANQAVASAKLGGNVTMIGSVGSDVFGEELKANLKEQGVSVEHIGQSADAPTGIASIILSNGDNRIIVVPGANQGVTSAMIEEKEEMIASSDVLLLQLEIPLETVEKAAEIAKKHHVKVILNPAPIQPLSEELLEKVDFITPNEHELALLLKRIQSKETKKDLYEKLIVTKGAEGVTYYQNGREHHISSYKVEAVDTTGAGDSFNGAFAVGISRGMTKREACQLGNAVGALSVTKLGAQTGMPTQQEVEKFLEKMK
ncbi:ribokinase [Bacillus taeanensis]|uniref:Ribokinase n=1 Tax=Bacillus taeanensis TaxID=273032 RepID=A0A366XSG0_9BACI|nr:ribokinase [Bacillus taeanensis]RBW69320.1 ribokinase [Bacillus taeanensis]